MGGQSPKYDAGMQPDLFLVAKFWLYVPQGVTMRTAAGHCRRVWPKQDEREVNMFVSLVHHVTGNTAREEPVRG